MALDDALVDTLRNAVRNSLGLDDDETIVLDRKFKDYDPNVNKLDLLEIFQAVGISLANLKKYFTENSLTDDGIKLLRKIGAYATNESPNALAAEPNLLALAETKNLDELARNATLFDFFYIAEYLDKYQLTA